ncbi:hypothetical protein EYF80_030304 [Liparis tanakae]|uniref:Secreted protein n=1 Tax=Liparis tanakae TaxID=230148 RepID=A0A4Z2H152_9TELE|nr:hypothetical protein EYF80_030304 [Liparis tanakae]
MARCPVLLLVLVLVVVVKRRLQDQRRFTRVETFDERTDSGPSEPNALDRNAARNRARLTSELSDCVSSSSSPPSSSSSSSELPELLVVERPEPKSESGYARSE